MSNNKENENTDSTALIATTNNKFLYPTSIDDYTDLDLSSGTKEKLSRVITSTKTGIVSMTPLICKGAPSCPFYRRCPIYLADDSNHQYPIDKQCIVEINIAQNRFNAYLEELSEQGYPTNSISLKSQISKLVEYDIMDYRINLLLAGIHEKADGTYLSNSFTGVTEDGRDIYELEENPLMEIQDRIQRQRMLLFRVMGLTKESDAKIKAALKLKESDNFLTRSLELLERVADLEKAYQEK